MKKYLVTLLVLFSTVLCYGNDAWTETQGAPSYYQEMPEVKWKFPKNPDRVPSLGINWRGLEGSGDSQVLTDPEYAEEYGHDPMYDGNVPVTEHSTGISIDLRLPVSNYITITLGVEQNMYRKTYDDIHNIRKVNENILSHTYTIGARFYLAQ